MIYLTLYFIFFKIGLFTIGGGYAMIPLIQQELSKGYLTMEEIMDVFAISEMTPGPFAVNAATFAGMKLYSLPGAVVCTLGVISPSLILTTIISLFFFNINQKAPVKAALYGMRPAVWALILSAVFLMSQTALFLPGGSFSPDTVNIIICAVIFLCLIFIKKISPVFFILAAGVFGAVFIR